jgi:hypothetical protein
MSREGQLLRSAGVALGIFLAFLVVGVFVLTQTDWGREQVRRFAVDRINRGADGEVAVGRVEGNLLRKIRLVDVSIVDAERRPFVLADTVEARFSLRSILRRRLVLTDMRVVDAEVVLDKPPGEDWNWVRIFPRDPPPVEPTRPGFGDWIELRDLTLVDGRVTIRTEWEPAADLTPAEREEAVRRILAGEGRENVERVAGGYQNVMDFRDLNAELPLVIAAHPDSAAIPIEVARFSGIVQPYRPPVATVRDLSGSFRLMTDTLFMRDVQAVLPGSRLAGNGFYGLDTGELFLRLHGSPVAFADLRWIYPALPEEGGGTLRLDLHRRTLLTRLIATEMDLRAGEATLEGRIDLTVGDTLRLRDTDVRFERVHTRLVERVIPGFEAPRQGSLTGELALEGHPEAMQLDGDVTFADDVGGTSRVLAVGELAVADEVRVRDLRLQFRPLQAELLRVAVPQAPLRGTIEGYANLTGTFAGFLDLDSDLTLRDPRAGVSRVRALGGVEWEEEVRLHDLLVRLDPLRLDLLRDEIPELPAGATVAGEIRLDGTPARSLRLDGSLALTDPATGVSRVAGAGGVVFGEQLALQDLRLRFDPLQLDLARPWVPELPAGASAAGPLRLDGSPRGLLALEGDLRVDDPATGVSQLRAAGSVDLAGQFAFRRLHVETDPLQLDLVRRWVPELPEGATVTGQAVLDGAPAGTLHVDGDATIRDPVSGESRIAAVGGIDATGEVRFEDLSLRFAPLRLDLVRRWVPELPEGAVVEGPLRLDGSLGGVLALDGDLRLDDPATGVSQLRAGGSVDFAGPFAFRRLHVETDPLQLDLVRRWVPELPEGATVTGQAMLEGAPARMLHVDGDATIRDPATGVSRVVAHGGIRTADELRFESLALRFDPLQMNLVQAYLADVPGTGTLEGRLRLDGPPSGMLHVDGDLTLLDPVRGTSHVVATGGVDLRERRFADLRLDLAPLQMDYVRGVVPELPLGGTLSGTATLNGSLDARLAIRGDLEHREAGELSRVVGDVLIVPGEDGFAAVDVRFLPLSLEVAGRFVPEAGLRGSVSGSFRAQGDLEALAVDADLAVAGGGTFAATGTLDLAAPQLGYDLRARMSDFDLAAVTARAPATTSLTGDAIATGRGTDPATMRAEVVADLVGPRVDDVAMDEVRLRVGIADGLLRTDSSVVRFATAEAVLDGTFGLVAGREGLLTYRITSDDLGAFAEWVPPAGPPGEDRPALNVLGVPRAPPAREEEVHREDLAEAETEPLTDRPAVAATRERRPPDDPLGGRFFAEGGVRGNLHAFDLWGQAIAEDLVVQGNEVGAGWANYVLSGVGTPDLQVTLDTELREVRTAGIVFDSIDARVRYDGARLGTGTAVIAAYSDANADLLADLDFSLALERRELALREVEVRVDTVTWRTTGPSTLAWGEPGLSVAGLELVSDAGGRIQVDGRLPVDGEADMDILVQDLEIGHVVALLQADRQAAGRLDLDARVLGTGRDPIVTGAGSLTAGMLDGRRLPDARATFSYAGRELVANA